MGVHVLPAVLFAAAVATAWPSIDGPVVLLSLLLFLRARAPVSQCFCGAFCVDFLGLLSRMARSACRWCQVLGTGGMCIPVIMLVGLKGDEIWSILISWTTL